MPTYDNIYDRLDAGKGAEGSVLDDIAEMSIDEMEDYFGDTDPVEFL
jgi:hypothetical protein